MKFLVEQNNEWIEVDKSQLLTLIQSGKATHETRINVDGQLANVGQIIGTVFPTEFTAEPATIPSPAPADLQPNEKIDRPTLFNLSVPANNTNRETPQNPENNNISNSSDRTMPSNDIYDAESAPSPVENMIEETNESSSTPFQPSAQENKLDVPAPAATEESINAPDKRSPKYFLKRNKNKISAKLFSMPRKLMQLLSVKKYKCFSLIFALILVFIVLGLLISPFNKKQVRQGKEAGEKYTLNIKGIDYTFRWCPAGTFMMGSPENEEGRNKNEHQHQVTLTKGFWILETEITQEMWQSVMGNNPSQLKGKQLPVDSVDWYDCQEFIYILNRETDKYFSLPTEAQWEYACRAGSTTPFNFGRKLDGNEANCDGRYGYRKERYGNEDNTGKYLEKTSEVRSYSPNYWGLFDTHGNVAEWCSDGYGDYPLEESIDPKGLEKTNLRVIRGGSWDSIPCFCRSAYRESGDLNTDNEESDINQDLSALGFRIILSTEKNNKDVIENGMALFIQYRVAAKLGDADAQMKLGKCYYEGKVVETNYKKAVEWYQKASDQGNYIAQQFLCHCYINGEGVDKTDAEVVEWYRKESEKGNYYATCFLGLCYAQGKGVDKNEAKAIEWYRKAAAHENLSAQFQLGNCYKEGQGVSKDDAEAAKWFKKAIKNLRKLANKGESTAQFALGELYKHGMYVGQNYKEATQWYRKAAEQGDTDALFNLGKCCAEGKGVPKDFTKAVEWYERAADKGNDEAMFYLGKCCAEGSGVPKDLAKAVEWYQRAANYYNPDAMMSLGDCYAEGKGVPKDLTKAEEYYQEAVEWYKRPTSYYNPEVMLSLGDCYAEGKGVPKDLTKAEEYYQEAVEWYQRAAEKGNTEAKDRLKKIKAN